MYGYKIDIKVSGNIDGATSEPQHTPTQLWLKNVLEKKYILKISKEMKLIITIKIKKIYQINQGYTVRKEGKNFDMEVK